MSISQPASSLAEQLSSMIEGVPEAVDVVQLAQPDVGTVHRRLRDLVGQVTGATGLEPGRLEVESKGVRTVMSIPGRLRAVGFHASGAMSVTLGLAPFDDIFGADQGDEELTGLSRRAAEGLGLSRLLPEGESLPFERLWRIKAAAGDRTGKVTEPVLCRAVGAFRHFVNELPVYGRASATVELAAEGRLASASLSVRRFAGDDGGRTVAKAPVRQPEAAAQEVAARLDRSFGGLENPDGTRLVAEWFRFGYLSLGRRRTQALLAPFYLASVAVEHEYEASAQIIAVSGTEEQFVRLPPSRPASAKPRTPIGPSAEGR
jgi:hypothetical protein